MTELETLERAKMYMEKLANGINPIDGTTIPDDDVINNVRLSRCFFYVADVLRQVIDNGGVVPRQKLKKVPFDLPVEKRVAFAFSDEAITVSEIVKRINELVAEENMVKLTTTVLTEWLISIDLLSNELNTQGKLTKRPTPGGISMGITMEERTGMNGPYSVVVYNPEAQHFILDNLDAALETRRQKTENQGQPWSAEHDTCLRELVQGNASVDEIAIALKRNSSAIRARLKKLGIT